MGDGGFHSMGALQQRCVLSRWFWRVRITETKDASIRIDSPQSGKKGAVGQTRRFGEPEKAIAEPSDLPPPTSRADGKLGEAESLVVCLGLWEPPHDLVVAPAMILIGGR